MKKPELGFPCWQDKDGAPISCLEKIKVLNQNYAELRQVAIDMLDDGVLMGCSEKALRSELVELILSLYSPFSQPGEFE